MNKLHIYIFFIIVCFLSSGCDLNVWDLPDQSNKFIPNYALRATTASVVPSMQSSLHQEDDHNFITCIESPSESINIIRLTQSFDEANDQWEVTSTNLHTVVGSDLNGFLQYEDKSLLAYEENTETVLTLLSDYDEELYRFDQFESYLDTAYNDMDSLEINSLALSSDSLSYFVGGQLYSFGRSYSFAMGFDEELSPQWVKTYFEDSSIDGISNTGGDTLVMIHTNADGSDLIRDNAKGTNYQKINIADISFDQLYFGSALERYDNGIIVSGVNDSIGRIIRVDLDNLSSYIIESAIYPVAEISTVRLSRDTWVVAGVQTGADEKFFITEMDDLGSQWCHRYINEKYVRTFGAIENEGKGISALGLAESDGLFYINLIRIDEEGATFIDEFTESCI